MLSILITPPPSSSTSGSTNISTAPAVNFLFMIDNPNSINGQQFSPLSVAVSKGEDIYVLDADGVNTVLKYNRAGVFISQFDSSGSGHGPASAGLVFDEIVPIAGVPTTSSFGG